MMRLGIEAKKFYVVIVCFIYLKKRLKANMPKFEEFVLLGDG